MYVLHGHVEKGKFVSLGDLKSRKDPSVWQIPQVGVNEKKNKQNQNKIKKQTPNPFHVNEWRTEVGEQKTVTQSSPKALAQAITYE